MVVTYNGRKYVDNCLRTLIDSSPDNIDVVVVDNDSADGTAAYVREFFPSIRVVESGANLGYGEANNKGALTGTGQYIAVLNQDALVTTGWLTPLIDALEAHPAVGLVTPKILQHDTPDRINTCGNAPHYTGITPCRGFDAPVDAPAYAGSHQVGAVSGAAFLIRRDLFDAIGGFDGSFFLYLEDTDLSLRALSAGYESWYVADSTVLHEFEPRFGTDKLFFLERNRYVMLLKLYRWRTLVALLPALCLTEVAVWGYALLRGPSAVRSKARAWWSLLRALPDVLKRRKSVQLLRQRPDRDILSACEATLDLKELGMQTGGFAMAVLNPLFSRWHRVLLAVVRW